MNLPTCNDFCTANKCWELEQKIAELQFQLDGLRLLVNDHISQDIPTAHDYNPQKSNLALNGSYESEILTLTVADGESQDSTQINIPLPEVPEYKESNLALSGSFQSEILTLTVADGESSATAQINIPLPEIPEHQESNLAINGIFQSEILTLTVADGESSDTTQISIPLNETTNITNNNYGGGGETLECPNIETKIDDCCIEILNAINQSQTNVINEINNTETVIITDVSEVKDAVCIDITGTTSGDYSCEFEADEEGNIIPTYAVSKVQEKTYQGKGFGGIHEILKLIQENLTYLHSDICKAVDPIHTITLDDIYNFCNNSQIQRSDYAEGIEGDEQYQQAIKDYLQALLLDTKYGYLIEKLTEANPTNLITAPDNWTNFILTDFALIQSRINREAICNIDIPEMPDVVTIVASEKDVHRVKTKSLVLHFVTLDAYPKRSANQGYRPVQIPAAKEAYDWVADFDGLRWTQGNQYAELRFVEPYNPVSGWFADADAANAYFDQVLTLTTATEDNRVIPVHSNPKTDYPVQASRPYRAFIVSVNEKREKLCHAKYVPIIEV